MKKGESKVFTTKDDSFIATPGAVHDTWLVTYSRIVVKPVGIIELDSRGLWFIADPGRIGILSWGVMVGVADLMKQIAKQNRLKVL